MTHDPFQTHSAWGAYAGAPTPFNNPYLALQNPQAGGFSQIGQQMPGQQMQQGFGAYGGYGAGIGFGPQQQIQQLQQQLQQQQQQQQQLLQQLQQLQLAQALAAQQAIPQLQNPLLNNPMVNPILGQQLGQYPQTGQFGSPYGHIGNPYGSGLAPQSWVGGGQQGYGQIHPLLAQFGGRGF